MTDLIITDLSVNYGQIPALQHANATVPAGSITGVIGPNGAGKSTMIKACLGLVKAHSGTALYGGTELKHNTQAVGYVPQHTSVDWDFPATASDVVAMGALGARSLRSHSARKTAVEQALQDVGAEHFAHFPIGKLSGGQKQRVFLARALVKNPPLLILDEPFAGVDLPSERAIIKVLRRLQAAGTTAMIVHHDLSTAADYFTHVVLVNKTVLAAGSTATTFTQENLAKTYGIAV